MYYFVKDEEAISTAFADALGGLLSVVAQKIQMFITVSVSLEHPLKSSNLLIAKISACEWSTHPKNTRHHCTSEEK